MALALLVSTARAARASDVESDAPAQGGRWGLGIAGVVTQKPYRDIGTQTTGFPLMVVYESRWLSVYGPSASLNLPSAGPVAFSLTASLSRDGYKASDSRYLAGMDERKDKLWLGGSAKWRTAYADTTAEWMSDVSGNSKGNKFSLSVEHVFDLGRFELSPRLGAVWLDGSYVNYYYGVQAHEASAGRPTYAPKGTFNIEAGLRAAYRIAHRDSLFLDIGVYRLGTQIEDSPLVGNSTPSRIVLGYVHVF